jgi:hypothetical protein
MRDAAAAVERSKRTLALAIAGDQQEGRRLDATNARIADLELLRRRVRPVGEQLLGARRPLSKRGVETEL